MHGGNIVYGTEVEIHSAQKNLSSPKSIFLAGWKVFVFSTEEKFKIPEYRKVAYLFVLGLKAQFSLYATITHKQVRDENPIWRRNHCIMIIGTLYYCMDRGNSWSHNR